MAQAPSTIEIPKMMGIGDSRFRTAEAGSGQLLPITLPYAFFFALFPVYFVYHSLLSADLIPPVLGGGWSIFTVPGFLILAPIVALRSEDWRIHTLCSCWQPGLGFTRSYISCSALNGSATRNFCSRVSS